MSVEVWGEDVVVEERGQEVGEAAAGEEEAGEVGCAEVVGG